LPETASAAKVERLGRFDVRLVRAGENYDAAEAHGLRLAVDQDARFISAYNDADVIAGQRTLAVEIGEPVGPTLADGMAGGLKEGSVTVPIARRHVHDLMAVSEGELRDAIRALTFEQGLVVEGAGTAAAAAVLAGRIVDERPGSRIVVVLSGRNISPQTLLDVLHEPD